MITIKKIKNHFQILLSFIAVAANNNLRSRFITFMRRNFIELINVIILLSIENEMKNETQSNNLFKIRIF